jgi:hypothetical protein
VPDEEKVVQVPQKKSVWASHNASPCVFMWTFAALTSLTNGDCPLVVVQVTLPPLESVDCEVGDAMIMEAKARVERVKSFMMSGRLGIEFAEESLESIVRLKKWNFSIKLRHL